MAPKGNWLEIDPNLALPGLWDLIVATRGNPANLFESWGREAVFERNAPAIAAALKLDGNTVPPTGVLELIKGTGILDRIPFSTVRSEEQPSPDDEYDVTVAAGTIAWSVRRAQELKLQLDNGLVVKRIFVLASDRACNSSTEINHPYVRKYQEHLATTAHQEPDYNQPVIEAGIVPFIVQDITGLVVEKGNVIVGKTLDDNVATLTATHPELAEANIYAPGNANASVSLQIRRGLKTAFPDFDRYTGKFTFSRDDFPLAENAEQAADPAHYQRPFTALSGIVRELNELHKLEA